MKLIKTNCKYTYNYEIKSEYKIGDSVTFIEKSNLVGQTGTIIGVVGLEYETNYLVNRNMEIRNGWGACIAKIPSGDTGIFTSEQIKARQED